MVPSATSTNEQTVASAGLKSSNRRRADDMACDWVNLPLPNL